MARPLTRPYYNGQNPYYNVRCAPSHPLDLEFARLLSIEECVRDYRGAIGSEEWRRSGATVGLHAWHSKLGCIRGGCMCRSWAACVAFHEYS